MKLNDCLKVLAVGAALSAGSAIAGETDGTGRINYTWMNAVINKTPVVSAACPSIETDIYRSGFKVARQKGYFGNLMASRSKWFPRNSQWASVGVGPVKNGFGIFFSDINKLSELSAEKEKRLPDTYEEINNWKVSDAAYWESQGGIAFYLGTGISPIDIGVFTVATGGWTNYLQKTGPNKVYVEMSKKKIRSISFGGGVGIPHAGLEKSFENSKGFSYEFVLDNQVNIEAFERFMAGDMTRAQDLAKLKDSGINKISDLSETRTGLTRGFGMATPFIPILSFQSSSSRDYDHSEENSVWDEKVVKDTGIYVKQRSTFLAGKQVKEARSFVGGRVTVDVPGFEGVASSTEKLFGNFKYSYQSNWGQEDRLRKYIKRAQSFTGLTSETCARVPAFKDSLGFSQVVLEVSWSDEYVRELLATSNSKTSLIQKIKSQALKYQSFAQDENSATVPCDVSESNDDNDSCLAAAPDVNIVFDNLEGYLAKMNKTMKTDRKEFAKNLAKFGEQIWKSPFVFKAFYEKGKVCGQEFKYEVSGLRLTRHNIAQKYNYSAACSL